MPNENDTLTEYVVKWYVPQLAEWVQVGRYRRLEQAQDAEKGFRWKIRDNWQGEIETTIVKVVEEELTG